MQPSKREPIIVAAVELRGVSAAIFAQTAEHKRLIAGHVRDLKVAACPRDAAAILFDHDIASAHPVGSVSRNSVESAPA